MALKRGSLGDVDAVRNALRPRMKRITGGTGPAPALPPHRHAASEIDYAPSEHFASDDVQELGEEIDAEKLQRAGDQPMLGNLDMNHYDVNNVKDLEVEHDETMTGGVGAAQLLGTRHIQMTGDDADLEGRIDGANALVLNGLSSTPSTDEAGRVDYDLREEQIVAYIVSGSGTVEVALGWSVLSAVNGSGDVIDRFKIVEVYADALGRPSIRLWNPDTYEQPGLSISHRVLGMTMTSSSDGEPVAVMRRGIMRACSRPLTEEWAVRDILFGVDGGDVSNIRPAAPQPVCLVGTAYQNVEGSWHVAVDVRVLPSLGELSGVLMETPEDRDVFIYNAATQTWDPRMLDHGADVVPASLLDDDHPQYTMRRWSWLTGD